MENEKLSHHPTLPPSSFPAFKKCPRFKSSARSTAAADEGTRQHKELENAIIKNIEPEEEGLAWAFNHIKDTFEILKPDEDFEKAEKLAEERIVIYDKYFNELSFGSADLIISNILFDLKSGMPRTYKPQLEMYCRGYMQRMLIDKMHVVELYPRTQASKNYEITLEECVKNSDEIIARVMNPELEANPNEYCKWCLNLLKCEKLNSAIGGYLKTFDKEFPEDFLKQINLKSLQSPDVLGKSLSLWRTYMKPYGEYLEILAKEALDSGEIPTGYRVQTRKGKRQVNNIIEIFQNMDLPPETFLNCCTLSLTQLHKKSKMKKAEFDNFVFNYVSEGKESKSLVKAEEEND